MAVYRNFDVHTRVWPGLQRADGRTLELEPGEEDELFDLPKGFSDPHLREVERKRIEPLAPKPKRRRKSKPTVPAPEPPPFRSFGFDDARVSGLNDPPEPEHEAGSPPDAYLNKQES